MSIRPVKFSRLAQPTMEGAGVNLHRVFGFGDTKPFDPFLMMDDFRNDEPDKYMKGFPWHPHRGIETITYVQVEQLSMLTALAIMVCWVMETFNG